MLCRVGFSKEKHPVGSTMYIHKYWPTVTLEPSTARTAKYEISKLWFGDKDRGVALQKNIPLAVI